MDKNLTTKEAAKYLNCSPGTLENWRIQGIGPTFYKPMGRVYYRQEDLDNFIKGVEAKQK